MKRLLLASDGISALPQLLARPTAGLQVAFVPTPAGPEAECQPWVRADRGQLESLGCRVSTLELATADTRDIPAALKKVDAVFVTGGNAYLVLWHARRTGFAALVPPLVETGTLIYVGTSAGAMLAGPDIEPAANPAAAPLFRRWKSTTALQLVAFSVLPHDQEPERHAMNAAIIERHGGAGFVALRDDQAILVRGSSSVIVDSPAVDSCGLLP